MAEVESPKNIVDKITDIAQAAVAATVLAGIAAASTWAGYTAIQDYRAGNAPTPELEKASKGDFKGNVIELIKEIPGATISEFSNSQNTITTVSKATIGVKGTNGTDNENISITFANYTNDAVINAVAIGRVVISDMNKSFIPAIITATASHPDQEPVYVGRITGSDEVILVTAQKDMKFKTHQEAVEGYYVYRVSPDGTFREVESKTYHDEYYVLGRGSVPVSRVNMKESDNVSSIDIPFDVSNSGMLGRYQPDQLSIPNQFYIGTGSHTWMVSPLGDGPGFWRMCAVEQSKSWPTSDKQLDIPLLVTAGTR